MIRGMGASPMHFAAAANRFFGDAKSRCAASCMSEAPMPH
jgi:hypothetical protein